MNTKKLSQMQTALAVMAAITGGDLDPATAADLRAVLDAGAAGHNLNRGLARALAAARSRAFEQVADAALAAAADGAPRGARNRLRAATASAGAVRALEMRLSGGTDTHVETAAVSAPPAVQPGGTDVHAETATPTVQFDGAELHVESVAQNDTVVMPETTAEGDHR